MAIGSLLMDETRDHAPLQLPTLLDRGAQVQPENLIVTKTSAGTWPPTFEGLYDPTNGVEQ